MLISVQSKRRDENGDLIVTVPDGHGGTDDWRLSGRDAAEVERVWAQCQTPAPGSVAVEINDDPVPALT